ncbi:S66 peptidase family protein [Legionella hackeliae]|uniref:Muramoyltetrapeptide carboxypeptidase n=1 Tax=Legionella hackeliae TaxID=449 RepID=A0A0A8UTD0_LEGHA|nr:LD-carboxypeptidase [Legionella hackeliae]KTD08921.1 LD-carboxypeptidase [Legionella hackeliae]CEK10352.1 Muramoyltetrapeptide carboxypeptidase [Legionella hackeliae]STX47083.1 LD-carboxypeptidase [Legionella hackeliae]
MQKLPVLNAGDSVEIIAPASRCTEKHLAELKELLVSWGLNCYIDDAILGDDLLCANHDAIRFASLKRALENPETKAVICARGGYGSMRLIPELTKLNQPSSPKIFIGMSDITALLLYFERQWQWPTIHGALAIDKFSEESIAAFKSLLFHREKANFQGKPLNAHAMKRSCLETTITGGNLSLVQTSIGTNWQIEGAGKIILLEEIGERGYRVDRMLNHLSQAKVFKEAAAILFGDFLGGLEPNGTSLIQPVLERFAAVCDVPVIQISGIGHGFINFPVPLGIPVQLKLGQTIQLSGIGQ